MTAPSSKPATSITIDDPLQLLAAHFDLACHIPKLVEYLLPHDENASMLGHLPQTESELFRRMDHEDEHIRACDDDPITAHVVKTALFDDYPEEVEEAIRSMDLDLTVDKLLARIASPQAGQSTLASSSTSKPALSPATSGGDVPTVAQSHNSPPSLKRSAPHPRDSQKRTRTQPQTADAKALVFTAAFQNLPLIDTVLRENDKSKLHITPVYNALRLVLESLDSAQVADLQQLLVDIVVPIHVKYLDDMTKFKHLKAALRNMHSLIEDHLHVDQVQDQTYIQGVIDAADVRAVKRMWIHPGQVRYSSQVYPPYSHITLAFVESVFEYLWHPSSWQGIYPDIAQIAGTVDVVYASDIGTDWTTLTRPGFAHITIPRMAYLSGFLLSAVYKRVYKYKAPDHEAFRLMVLSMSLAGNELAQARDWFVYSEISSLTEGGLIYPKRFVIAYLIWLDSALTKVLEASGRDKKLERSMWANRRVTDLLASSQHQRVWQLFVLQAQGYGSAKIFPASLWDRFAQLFRTPYLTLRVGERSLRQTQSEIKANSDRANTRQMLKSLDSV
ncbi:hypothetical protein BCR44DRAFT_61398 [Catenaria anguillulae PL171]|uniref:Uncharacterized protein n=1 Tax=Catenaria anguillulae PL171 TaxID=765915 RepID=A0A1Y2HBX9_9FUNG|nr:hypothetical protein BCR44DRAFT_61398 [Catenaria anguillulae PL171]